MNTNEKVIEQARLLIDRGTIAPGEARVIRQAALVLLQNNRTLTMEDHLILRFCRTSFGRDWHEPPESPAATPYDDEIAELEAKIETAKEVFGEAEDALWAAGREWAKVTKRAGYASSGVTLGGLLSDEELRASSIVEAQPGWRGPAPGPPPPDPARVHALVAEINVALTARNERRRELGRVQAKLTNTRVARDRWRATLREE